MNTYLEPAVQEVISELTKRIFSLENRVSILENGLKGSINEQV